MCLKVLLVNSDQSLKFKIVLNKLVNNLFGIPLKRTAVKPNQIELRFMRA